ncbi:hypothetical protein AB0E08_00120 [Streptomyces sp. NPDC048281]|uniref:hypothetical protein n=1 Tax=Streptomyces sp. NPDC048281 TaxID=3154715 RepID=UPI00343832D2
MQQSTRHENGPAALELTAGSRHPEPVDVRLILRRGGKVLLSWRAGDTYASGLLRQARHHVIVCVKSVWLVMETQHPDRHAYTFERIQELPLGR